MGTIYTKSSLGLMETQGPCLPTKERTRGLGSEIAVPVGKANNPLRHCRLMQSHYPTAAAWCCEAGSPITALFVQ